jgi:hypothetical protein
MSDQMEPPTAGPTGGAAGGASSVKGMATASLVLGIVAVVFALFCMPVTIVCALVGLPLGAIAYNRQNKGSAVADSKGMALAGMVLNGVGLIGGIVLAAIFGALFAGLMAELSDLSQF